MNYLKASCPHCANNVEYSPRDAGRAAECPHCHYALTLPREFPKQIILVTLLVLALIFGTITILSRQRFSIEGISSVAGVFALIFILATYFVPTVIALQRRHRNWPAILILNLAFGWTLLGWIAALIWSVHRDR